MVDLGKLGFHADNLYEILATTFIRKENEHKFYIPNTAAMGIRISNTNQIFMKPYPTSNTFKNLKGNQLLIINLVDNIYLYALAALKDVLFKEENQRLPQKVYKKLEISKIGINYDELVKEKSIFKKVFLYYLKEAWAIIPCIRYSERKIIKKGPFGQRKLTEFELKPLKWISFRDSFKVYNRAENLALEAIISATRLKIAQERNDKEQIKAIKADIERNFLLIERFGKNKNALAAKKIVEDYITSL